MLRLQATQNSMLQFQKLNPDVTAYHRSAAIEIEGMLDIPSLKAAVWEILFRHGALHSKISYEHRENVLALIPDQCLPHSTEWPLKIIDAQCIADAKLEDLPATLELLGESDFLTEPFNLSKGPLWRTALIQLANHKYQFVTLYHHIIVDETSIGILFQDIADIYNGISSGIPHSLQKIKPLHEYPLALNKDEKEKRLTYWKEKLKYITNFNMQTDFPEQKSFKFAGERIPFTLDSAIIKKMEALSSQKQVSLNTALLGCLYSLLQRYSGEEDICIGITSANRRFNDIPDAEIHHLVNCFFNSVPIRLNFSKETTFTHTLNTISNTVRDGLKNQLPLDSLFLEALDNTTKSSFNTASPFNVLFVLNKRKQPLRFNDLNVSEPIELDLGHAKFPYFGINLDEQEDGSYKCFLEYNTALFNQSSMVRFIKRFKETVHYVADHPQCNISTIPLLLEEEKEALSKYNVIKENPVYTEYVHDIFHRMAEESPELIAAVFHYKNGDKDTICYGDLEKSSNQLANYLKKFPDKTIGISVGRSTGLLIGIMGALKAGLTLVPLETTPCEALFHKVEHTHMKLILVDDTTKAIFHNTEVTIINLHDKNFLQFESADYHPEPIKPTDRAYIAYTSGTTSITPKGVPSTHNGFVNLLHALMQINIKPNTKVICTSLPTFDAFYFDWLVAIATKGSIHLPYEEGRFLSQVLEKIIEDENINYAVFLPDIHNKLPPQPSITDLVSMGAPANKETLFKWLKENPNLNIKIGFGLTETGICLSLHPYSPDSDSNLIGKPIDNMCMFILNPEDMSECPIGIPGEIYAAGPGLAEGYLDDPIQTQERFKEFAFDPIDCVFLKPSPQTAHLQTVRLNATGDYGCYWPHQNDLAIKLIGRKDRQIKIDGVRLELNAIESILLQHPGIQDVAILPNQTRTALQAYVVAKSDMLTPENLYSEIRRHLASTPFPPVAYPRACMLLSALPITANGKVDTKALPAISTRAHVIETESLSFMQKELRKIWASVLSCPKEEIELDNSFESLGGNSLLLASLEWQINHCDNLKFVEQAPPFILSKHTTIRKLEELMLPYLSSSESLIPLPFNHSIFEQYPSLFAQPPSPLQTSLNRSDASIPEIDQKNSL